MKYLIENYIKNLRIENVNEFAIQNNIYLARNELEFVYSFIKENGIDVLNRKSFDLSIYKDHFSEENYQKISMLLDIYLRKYQDYL